MNKKRTSLNLLAAAAMAALAGFTTSAQAAQIINVNLANVSGNTLTGTAHMSGGFAQAPAAYTGTTWNEATASPITQTNLLDSDGIATTVGFTTVSTNGAVALQAPATSAGAPDVKLLTGFVNRNYNSGSGNIMNNRFTVSGLNPAKTYNIYLASAHNTPVRCQWQLGTAAAATGSPKNIANTAATRTAETWVAGDDYVAFYKVAPDASGNIFVWGKGTAASAAESGITLNGFQVMDATGFLSPENDLLSMDFGAYGPATISGTNVTVNVPFSTNVTALAPTYTVSPGATGSPASGNSVNFTSPQTYTVTAENGTPKNYTVTVVKDPFGTVRVGNYSFEKFDTLVHGTWGAPSGNTALAVWTFGFVPPANSDACGINTNGGPWFTPNAPDGTRGGYMQGASTISQAITFGDTADYTVSFAVVGRAVSATGRDLTVTIDGVTVLSIPAADIGVTAWQNRITAVFEATAGVHTLAFTTGPTGGDADAIDNVAIKLANAADADMITCDFPGLGPATIAGTDVSITVPYGTGLLLSPTFTLSPFATCTPVSGTERNFITAQTYTVKSGDESVTKTYTVTVNVTPASTACDMLTFGPGATISGTDIAWTVLHSTNLATLAPTFTMSQSATCGQPNGAIPSPDFSAGPVHYVVHAQDGISSQNYTVTVTKAPASADCDILTFGPGAVITGTAIAWSVPYGTNLATLAPTYTVSPYAACDQPNGSIPTPDFSTGPVQYKVTAEDGTEKTYTVTIAVGPQVTFTLTPLGKTADSTGSEILNTGTFIQAYHFGDGPANTTVGGVVFTAGNSGTGPSYAETGLTGSTNGMMGWLSGQLGYTFTDAAYAELIDKAYVGGSPRLTIGGLTIGHEYRLQIILEDTRGTPTIEGVTGPALVPGNPGIVTATWVAKDDTLNMSWSGGASPHFSGYALHDMGGAISDFGTWANGFGAGFTDRAPGSDPDGDGLTNQQEYAFGLDPTSGASVNPITVPFDKTTGTFSYTRRNPALTGLGYTVLTSTDLLTWTPNGAGGSQTPDSPTAVIQTVTVVVDAAPVGGKLFVRVQAE